MSDIRKAIMERLGAVAEGEKAAMAIRSDDDVFNVLVEASDKGLDRHHLVREARRIRDVIDPHGSLGSGMLKHKLWPKLVNLAEQIQRLPAAYARPGAKAKMAISAAEARKIIATIEQRKAAATEWSPALDHLTKQRTFAQRLIVAHEQGDSANISRYSQLLEKAGWSRPGAKSAFGTNKRIIRHAGHEFLAEDEGNRTRISIKVDGAWEHATTVNTDNQTATEWIEANAKPGDPSRWLPHAFSRPGVKATMGFVGTAGQAGAIAARGMRDGAAAYRDGKPAVLNRLDPKYHGWSDKDLEVYGNFWMRGWTGEQMKEMRTRDPKQGIDLPGFRSSRPGAKAAFAITKEQIRGASREELRSIEQRLTALAKSGDKNAAALLDYVEEEYNDRYRGTHSRSGAKAKMEKWTVVMPSIPDAGTRHFDSWEQAKNYVDTKMGGFTALVSVNGKRYALKHALGQWEKFSRPGAKVTAAKPDDTEREDVKAGLKLMEKADKAVSDKIRTLIKEGKPQDQAVAIALDMKRRGEL